MSRNASDASACPEVPSSGVGDSSQVADANATGAIWATDIEIDRGVPSRSAADYNTCYPDTLDDQ